MCAIPVYIPFTIAALIQLPIQPLPVTVVRDLSYIPPTSPARFSCIASTNDVPLYAELQTTTDGLFSSEVKLFHQDSTLTKRYFKVGESSVLEITEDIVEASIFRLIKPIVANQISGRFQLQYVQPNISATNSTEMTDTTAEDSEGSSMQNEGSLVGLGQQETLIVQARRTKCPFTLVVASTSSSGLNPVIGKVDDPRLCELS